MRAALTLGLALCTSSAVAQELSVYVGGGIGELDHENETGGAFSDTVSSWKVYGGFQVGDHFSMEASHGETSTIEVRAPGGSLSVGNRLLQDAHSVDFELTTIRVMGRLPLDHIDLWMSVGSFRLEADVVPPPKSPFSSSSTESPCRAAAAATPRPLIPPPITRMS